jgi:dipeptidyl aminopeptidase/acylaminoacyl peptidase
LNPEPLGLWLGYANQAADGRIFALGAPGDRSGPREALRLYDMAGQPVSAPIMGDPAAPIERVEWSPDGLAVLVQIGGRQFTVSVTGTVSEITAQVQGAAAINWVSGNLPPSEELATAAVTPATPAVSGIPSGVIAGSAYQPGQQLRVYVLELNIRTGPGTEYPAVRGPLVPGDYVAILAGPMTTPDNVVWWQVQTADNYVGWIAGEINGSSTLGP